MQIQTKVTITDRGDLQKRLAALKKAIEGPQSVKVGFPAGEVGTDIVDIAIWNHEGTSRGIPPRPFITIAMFRGRAAIRAALRKIAENVLNGQALRPQLEKLGLLGVGLIQTQISSNTPPPNAPSTIKQKGSSKTLIDNGRMRQSVTHKVED